MASTLQVSDFHPVKREQHPLHDMTQDSGNTLYKREAVIVKIWAVLCRHLMSEMLG